MRRVERTDRGMTLVEILVGVAITGILMAGMFGALFVGIRTVDNTNDRIAGSNDTQLVASYFTSDVSSAESVSTTGATLHYAPSVTTSSDDSMLVSFWSLKRATAPTPPEVMSQGWSTVASSLSIAMADESLNGAGPTGDRVATSVEGTSSISHSVALAHGLLTNVTRTGATSTFDNGATSLTLSKPLTAGGGDVYLAHLAVAGGSLVTVTPPNGWTLLSQRDSGTELTSLVYLAKAPGGWTWLFTGTREAAGGVASYSGVASTPVDAKAVDVSPCGGDAPALLLRWTDRGTNVPTVVSYVGRDVDGAHVLLRLRCSGTAGTPESSATIARNLAANSIIAACSKPIVCKPLPITVTLSLSEPPPRREPTGRTYQLRAATRTTE